MQRDVRPIYFIKPLSHDMASRQLSDPVREVYAVEHTVRRKPLNDVGLVAAAILMGFALTVFLTE